LGWIVSRDGKWMARQVNGIDTVEVFETFTLQSVCQFTHAKANSTGLMRFSPDGRLLLVLATIPAKGRHDSERTYVWNLETKREQLGVDREHGYGFSPDSTKLATTVPVAGSAAQFRETHYRVKIWDLMSGQPLLESKERLTLVSSMEWSPDGRMLAVSCYNGGLKLLDTSSGRVMYELPNEERHRCFFPHVSFSSDSRFLFGALPDTL